MNRIKFNKRLCLINQMQLSNYEINVFKNLKRYEKGDK